MEIRIVGNGVEIPEALETHIRKRLSKLDRHWGAVDLVEVELRRQRHWHIVEITLSLQGRSLRSRGQANDFYTSLDGAVDRLDRQLLRQKGQLIQRSRRGSPAPPAPPLAEVGGEELPISFLRTYSVKPLSLEEAILQMEILQEPFFVFTDAASNAVHVLFRRDDGTLGLMVPEEGE